MKVAIAMPKKDSTIADGVKTSSSNSSASTSRSDILAPTITPEFKKDLMPGKASKLPPVAINSSSVGKSSGKPFRSFSDYWRQKMVEKGTPNAFTWAPKLPYLTDKNKSSSASSTSVPKYISSLWSSKNELVDGLFVPPRDPRKLNKLLKKNRKDTAGGRWFDMPAPTITPELKKDLEVLGFRNVADPKRHFKRADNSSLPKYFQIGTVIGPKAEYFSARLTKKERKTTFTDELLADHSLKDYRKRKVQEIEEQRRPGGVEKWKNKGSQTWKRTKHRRK